MLIYLGVLKYTGINMNTATKTTTVKIHLRTKQKLNKWREYRRESYDEVICKLVSIAQTVRDEPELSKQTVEAIEQARARIKEGKFVTEEQMRKRLSL